MKVIRIDGMYDCERDKVRVCQDMESYLNPNEGNKIFGQSGKNVKGFIN